VKIAQKISLSFFIAVIILTVIIASIFYITAKSSLEKTISANISAIAKSKRDNIEVFLREHMTQFEILADQMKELDPAIFNTILGKVEESDETVHELAIAGPEFRIIASSKEENIGRDMTLPSSWAELAEKSYLEDAHVSRASEKEVVGIYTPVTNGKEAIGILSAKIDLTCVKEITADRTGLGESGETYLLDRQGVMITPSRFVKDSVLKLKADAGMPGSQGASVYKNYRGIDVLGVRYPVSMAGWTLVVAIDKDEAFAPLGTIKLITSIIVIVAPVLGGIIGIFVSRVISGPIRRLRAGTEMIGKGNLDHKIGTISKDEIGQLSRAFDDMVENLKKTTASRDELKNAYARLKEAQQQLIQTEKLAAIGTFSSGIAHEVKNPLGVISSGLEYLEKRLSNSGKEVKEALEKIKESSEQANTVVTNLLRFAKPSKLKTEKIPAGDLVKGALSLITYEAGQASIDMRTGPSDEKICLDVDKNQIQQVLLNILLNAVDATPKGGAITVTTRAATRAETPLKAPACVIKIADTGTGIRAEDQKRLFEPFFSTKKDKKGTGLGLAISRTIVESHKGSLTIESKPEKGTVVKIILPAGEA